MSDASIKSLSGEEIRALRFAANRQLSRMAKQPKLRPDQLARRNALKRAVLVLRHQTFAYGCDLHAPDAGQQR